MRCSCHVSPDCRCSFPCLLALLTLLALLAHLTQDLARRAKSAAATVMSRAVEFRAAQLVVLLSPEQVDALVAALETPATIGEASPLHVVIPDVEDLQVSPAFIPSGFLSTPPGTNVH
jgi:hypothetical protein